MRKEYENVEIVVRNFANYDVITSSSNSFVNDGVWNENPWGGITAYLMEGQE